MKSVQTALVILHLSIVTLLPACAGKTKPYVPLQVEPLAEGLARIILTREDQIAGSGSPFEVVDIGDNVNPNSMMACQYMRGSDGMHYRVMPVKELSKHKYDGFVTAGLLWTNPELLTYIYCGNERRQCGSELKEQLLKQEGFLRGDVGLVGSKDYYALRLTAHVRSFMRPAGLLTGDEHAWTDQPVLSSNPPPLIDPDISLLEKARRQEFETVAIVWLTHSLQAL